MNKKGLYIVIISLLIVIFGLGFMVTRNFILSKQAGTAEKVIYYCPMHPDYKSDKPGTCPICGMNLVKAETEKPSAQAKKEKKLLYYRNPMNPEVTSPTPMKDSMGMDYVAVYEEETIPEQTVHEGVYISTERQQLIGVKTDIAKYRKLNKIVRAAGKIAYDPELYNAEVEYLEALRAGAATKESPVPEVAQNSKELVASARMRLILLGLGDAQIDELEKKNKVSENLLLSKAGGTVWMYADIYEYESGLVKIGQKATAYSKAFPDKTFSGIVRSVGPVLNPDTRTVRIRVELKNPEGLLKPEMFVNAEINVDLGDVLSVPKDAVMDTGTRQLVFVDKGDGYFAPKDVKLGRETDNYYEIISGIKSGEKIVTSANFLVDSESRLKSALKQMK